PPERQIPRRQFHPHPLAHEHPDEIPLEPPADVRRNPVRLDLDFVQPARQLRPDDALDRPAALGHTESSCLARPASAGSSVRISHLSPVTTTVCSKCAERLPSRVTAVQPSESTFTAGF